LFFRMLNLCDYNHQNCWKLSNKKSFSKHEALLYRAWFANNLDVNAKLFSTAIFYISNGCIFIKNTLKMSSKEMMEVTVNTIAWDFFRPSVFLTINFLGTILQSLYTLLENLLSCSKEWQCFLLILYDINWRI
jgi:hypothetical protein